MSTVKEKVSDERWDDIQLPTMPMDFVHRALVREGVEVLHKWLSQNAPQEVRDLAYAIDWAFTYQTAVIKHGKVSEALNEDAPIMVLEGLMAMEKLGYKW